MAKVVEIKGKFGGLSSCTRVWLQQEMEANFGKLAYCKKPPTTGDPEKDAAFCTFVNELDAEKAVETLRKPDGMLLGNGCTITGDWKGSGKGHKGNAAQQAHKWKGDYGDSRALLNPQSRSGRSRSRSRNQRHPPPQAGNDSRDRRHEGERRDPPARRRSRDRGDGNQHGGRRSPSRRRSYSRGRRPDDRSRDQRSRRRSDSRRDGRNERNEVQDRAQQSDIPQAAIQDSEEELCKAKSRRLERSKQVEAETKAAPPGTRIEFNPSEKLGLVLEKGESGRVTRVDADSQADRAGVKAGWVILEVGRSDVKDEKFSRDKLRFLCSDEKFSLEGRRLHYRLIFQESV